MSGHSKWAQIKHQKASADKKRGKLFSVLSKRISIEARKNKDPETNPGLKTIIEKAKAENMSADTIERAIKRGAGELPGQGPIEEVVYEAYGPEGMQLIIVTSTDNRNRTTSNIRYIINKFGGNISGQGSVMWNFTRDDQEFKPKSQQKVSKKTAQKINQLISDLEKDDDVEQVYTNLISD